MSTAITSTLNDVDYHPHYGVQILPILARYGNDPQLCIIPYALVIISGSFRHVLSVSLQTRQLLLGGLYIFSRARRGCQISFVRNDQARLVTKPLFIRLQFSAKD